jgi:hypothetical protein
MQETAKVISGISAKLRVSSGLTSFGYSYELYGERLSQGDAKGARGIEPFFAPRHLPFSGFNTVLVASDGRQDQKMNFQTV